MNTDPWATTTSTGLATFRPSLIERARKRTVHPSALGSFVVDGDARLGDGYEAYEVKFDGRKYTCECTTHGGGEFRRGANCSHVIAVMLYRKKRRVVEAAKARLAMRQNGHSPEVHDLAQPGSGNIPSSPPLVSGPAEPEIEREEPPPHPAQPGSALAPPSDPSWGLVPLPAWVREFRPHQIDALARIEAAYANGAKVVFLQAPTGSGKSLIGEMARRRQEARCAYVVTTKHLQGQLVRDYPYASVLKGRANYTPTDSPWGEATCADCTRAGGPNCRLCKDVNWCPYTVAKRAAAGNPLAILNTSYLLADTNYNPKSPWPGRFMVLDEADLLEEELMGMVEVEISPRRQKQLGIAPPAKKTVEESWAEWVESALPIVGSALDSLPPLSRCDLRQGRERQYLGNLLDKLNVLKAELPEGGWVYTGYEKGNDGSIVFKPVRVSKFGHGMLWRHAERFLLMSATIISPDEMADSLGLRDAWELVDVPSTFPPENAPIHVCAIAEMTSKQEEWARGKVALAMEKVLDRHPDERVLVHTVSYRLAHWLGEYLRVRGVSARRPVVTYGRSGEKGDALERYLASERSVMLAPSMDRGVDLPDDACRVQVVAKVPWPYTKDKQIERRLYSPGGQAWYRARTVRTLVQMLGRGVRSEGDRCESYILDHQFTSNLWRRSESIMPRWFKERLDWGFDSRTLR